MFERFTDRARRVVVLAQEEARLLNHSYIGTEHILLGLIHEGEGVAAKALESLGISLEAVRNQVEEIIGQGGSSPSGHIPFTPRAKKVLELSLREALQLGHNYIGTEHILLGLIREGEGVAAQVLVKLGADLSRVRQQVIQLLSGYQGPSGRSESSGTAGANVGGSTKEDPAGDKGNSQILDQFGRNFTQLARERKLDPVIGRTRELERVMQILSRRTKNNPVLIGEPGVGKTAIVEGLAQMIVNNDVPDTLRNKQLYTLDLGALVAGSRVPRRLRGAPEEGAQGDQDPRRHPAVHRRDPHARRRRRGRGGHRRGLDPQADARPRRAADDRRDDHRRVPQVRREGRRPRAPLPAGEGRRADARPHDRDPQGHPRPVRGAPPGDDHRPGARRRGQPRRPLHLRPLPAGQGDRPHRRGGQPPAHQAHGHAARPARHRAEAEPGPGGQEVRRRGAALRGGRAPARPGEVTARGEERQGGRGALRGRRPLRRGRRGGHRRGAQHLDRHPGVQAHRGGDPEADQHGGRAAQADHRPGVGGRRRLAVDPPHTGRPQGPEAARAGRSSSSARRASARPSWPRRSPSSCSATTRR